MFVLILTPAAPASSAPKDEESITITIDEVSPQIVDEGDDITFRGEITNNTSSPLSQVTVWWRMRTPVLTTNSLDTWMTEEDDDVAPLTLARHDLDKDIKPGKTKKFTMVVDVDNSPFDYGSKPGVRGIEHIVTGVDDEGTTLRDSDRSTLIWYPQDQVDPIPLTIAVPLTPTKTEWRQALNHHTPVADASAERLTSVIEAFNSQEVTWGIDGSVVDSVPLGYVDEFTNDDGDGEQFDGDELLNFTPSGGAQSVVDALSLGKNDTVISLGWAAPNYNLLSQTGAVGRDLHEMNSAYATDLLAAQGISLNEDTLWSLTPVSAGLMSSLDDQATTLITPPTTPETDYVPPTASHLTVRSASVDFVDLMLSDIDSDELLAQALVRAQDRGNLLVTLPPDTNAEQARTAAKNITTLSSTPWFDLGPPTSVEDPDYSSQPPSPQSQPVLDSAQVTQLFSSLEHIQSLATISEDPEEFSALFHTTAFLAFSHVWSTDDSTPKRLTQAVEHSLDSPALEITQPATVNLISQGGDLPISVANASPFTFRPTVVVQPQDARLRADDQVTSSLPAHHSSTVHVPITAVANGNVETTVQLLDSNGEEIAAPQTFTVRVRADWETTGTAVVAGVVAVGFLFGLIRNIRKSPKRVTQGRYE